MKIARKSCGPHFKAKEDIQHNTYTTNNKILSEIQIVNYIRQLKT